MVFAAISGCATATFKQAETTVTNHQINYNKSNVFDAALVVAQVLNLDVSVLEKSSGLIRFETARLSPGQLDLYCVYPFINPQTKEPWDTFQNWNARSVSSGGGQVRGQVSISVLISSVSEQVSNVNLRSNWAVSNNVENHPCNSKGVFEGRYISELKKQLIQ